jgi:hypothetical protein
MKFATSLYLTLVFLGSFPANTLAAEAEEEYAPIPELNYTPPKKAKSDSMFDDVRLHAGAAYISSFQDVPVGGGNRARGGLRGAQFNFGIDLFSQYWILQGNLFSLPQTTFDQAQVSENGFELRQVFETSILESVTFHGGLGIEDRNYSIKSQNGDNSMSSGAWVSTAGVDYWPAPFISSGIELSAHLPLANGDDPSSYDLGVRVSGHF